MGRVAPRGSAEGSYPYHQPRVMGDHISNHRSPAVNLYLPRPWHSPPHTSPSTNPNSYPTAKIIATNEIAQCQMTNTNNDWTLFTPFILTDCYIVLTVNRLDSEESKKNISSSRNLKLLKCTLPKVTVDYHRYLTETLAEPLLTGWRHKAELATSKHWVTQKKWEIKRRVVHRR